MHYFLKKPLDCVGRQKEQLAWKSEQLKVEKGTLTHRSEVLNLQRLVYFYHLCSFVLKFGRRSQVHS